MVFKFLNDRRHFDVVTSDGRLFQVLAAATGNARSPIVESRVSGTASAEVDDERRCCRHWLFVDAARPSVQSLPVCVCPMRAVSSKNI